MKAKTLVTLILFALTITIGVLALAVPKSKASLDLHTDLYAYWNFNEWSKGDRYDSTGNYTLTHHNNPTTVMGVVSYAVDFDWGSANWLDNSVITTFNTAPWTLATWISNTEVNPGDSRHIIASRFSYDGDVDYEWWLLFDDNTGIVKFVMYHGAGFSQVSGTLSAAGGQPTHIVVWYDDIPGDYGQIGLKMNYTQTYTVLLTGTARVDPDTIFQVGRFLLGPPYSDLTLDEMGIWRRKLLDSEMCALYKKVVYPFHGVDLDCGYFYLPDLPTPIWTYTPYPTLTPSGPTLTPRPTLTPYPTYTPWATLTPDPLLPTQTPYATNTPFSFIASPTPFHTPTPTDIPYPYPISRRFPYPIYSSDGSVKYAR